MKPTVVRQCGLMEHYSTSRHNLGFYRGIANSCQYVITRDVLQGQPLREVIEQAVARLVLRLGGLRVGITGEDTTKACFVSVPSMDLRDFVEWKTVAAADPARHDEQVLQGIKSRLEQLWPDTANRPPWKLLVVRDESRAQEDTIALDLIFVNHHAIADGKSTTVFHSELLRELNTPCGPPPELADHILTFDAPPVLAPSQEDLVDLKISWSYFLATLWDAFAPGWLKPAPPPAPWTGRPVAIEPNALQLRLVTINPQTVRRLVSTCRAHGTTLSGILHILTLASMARRVPAHVASSFAGETAISLLPWARLPPGTGLDVAGVLTDLNTGTKSVWDAAVVSKLRAGFGGGDGDSGAEEALLWPLAAAWRDGIKAKVATLPNDDIVGMLPYAGDFNTWWLQKVGKPRSATWALSNIGLIRDSMGEDHRGWRITRALFSQPVHVAGPTFALNVVGLKDGPVNVVFSWQDGVIKTTTMDGVVADMHRWLDTFEKDGKFGIFTGARET